MAPCAHREARRESGLFRVSSQEHHELAGPIVDDLILRYLMAAVLVGPI